MVKEKLTLDNLTKDLLARAELEFEKEEDKNGVYIGVIWGVGLGFALLLGRLWIFAIAFLLSAYPLVKSILLQVKYMKKKKERRISIARKEISVSVEKLSRVDEEYAVQPHTRHHHRSSNLGIGLLKSVFVFRFDSGASWRGYDPSDAVYSRRIKRYKLYKWSAEYCLSNKGLEQISLPGDEFFCVSLLGKAEIECIYPCKLFELSDEFSNEIK